MNLILKLDMLFKEWIRCQSEEPVESLKQTMEGLLNIPVDNFVIDGCINEEAYLKAPQKVLFISSEPNVEGKGVSGISNYRNEYSEYWSTHKDKWKGKMKERISALYAALLQLDNNNYFRYANQFAVMDINKRGGPSKIKQISRIASYARYYKNFIVDEIKILNPDIVVWIGFNTYNANIPDLLGCINVKNNKYFDFNNKLIPIIPMWHTSYYQAQIAPMEGYSNKIVGKLCRKIIDEYEKFTCGG